MNPTWGSENLGEPQRPVDPSHPRGQGAAGDCHQGDVASDFDLNSPLESLNLDELLLPLENENIEDVSEGTRDPTTQKSLNELFNLLNNSIDRVITISDDSPLLSSCDSLAKIPQELDASSGAMMDDLINLVTSTIRELRDISNTNLKQAVPDHDSIETVSSHRNLRCANIRTENLLHRGSPHIDVSAFDVPEVFRRSENHQMTALVHPDLTKEKMSCQGTTDGVENNKKSELVQDLKTDHTLVTENKHPRFSDEIWIEQKISNGVFATCPPELVEIYSEKHKKLNNRTCYSNFSMESSPLESSARENDFEKFKLSTTRKKASTLTMKSINFEDEMWPISPRLIGGRDLSIFIPENVSEIVTPRNLDKNCIEITDEHQCLSVRALKDSVDVDDSKKMPNTVEPTHEEEHAVIANSKAIIDLGATVRKPNEDAKDALHLNSDECVIAEGEMKAHDNALTQPSTEPKPKIMSNPRNGSFVNVKTVVQHPETDCADHKLRRIHCPPPNSSLSVEKQFILDNLVKRKFTTPNSLVIEEQYPETKGKAMTIVRGNIPVTASAEYRQSGKEKNPMPNNLIHDKSYQDERHANIDSVVRIGNIPNKKKKNELSISNQFPSYSMERVIPGRKMSDPRIAGHYNFLEKVFSPDEIVCKISKDVDQTSESSAASSWRAPADKPSTTSKPKAYYEIHIPESYVSPFGPPPLPSTIPNAEKVEQNKVMKSNEKKSKKCAGGRVKVLARRTGVRNDAKNSSSKHAEGTKQLQIDCEENESQAEFPVPNNFARNISSQGFKQVMNNVTEQIARQSEVEPVHENVVEILAEVELKMEANRKIAERIQLHQPNALVRLVPSQDAARLLIKASTRCKNFIQSSGYSPEATEKVNELLANVAHSLKDAIKEQRTSLIAQEESYARQSRVNASARDHRHSKRSQRERSSIVKKPIRQTINEVRSTLEEGNDTICTLISDILKLTKKIVLKNSEKETPRKSPRSVNKSQNPKSSPRNNDHHLKEPIESPHVKSHKASSTKDSDAGIETQMSKCMDRKDVNLKSERPSAELKIVPISLEDGDKQNSETHNNNDTINGIETNDADFNMSPKSKHPDEATKNMKRMMNDVWEKFAKPQIPSCVKESVSNTRSPSSAQRNIVSSKLPAWRPGGNVRIQSSTNITPINQKSRLPQSSSGRKRISVFADPLRVSENTHVNASEHTVTIPQKEPTKEEKRDDRVTRICQCLVETKVQQRLRGGPVPSKDTLKILEKPNLKLHPTKSLAKFKVPSVKSNHSEAFCIGRSKIHIPDSHTSEISMRKTMSKSRPRPGMPIKIPRAKIIEVPLEAAELPATEMSDTSPAIIDNGGNQRKKCSTSSEIMQMLEELIKTNNQTVQKSNYSVQKSGIPEDNNEGTANEIVLPVSKISSSEPIIETESSCMKVPDEYVRSISKADSIQSNSPFECGKIGDADESKENFLSQAQQRNCLNSCEILESKACDLPLGEMDSGVKELFVKHSTQYIHPQKETNMSSDTNFGEDTSTSKSNIEVNTSCSDCKFGTPSIKNIGCGTECSSDDSITTMKPKCCQASFVSLSSLNTSQSHISCKNEAVNVSMETQLDSLESFENYQVLKDAHDKSCQNSVIENSTYNIEVPKKKFINRHAQSLHMLKEILSGHGLDMELLDRAETEMKVRRNRKENKNTRRQIFQSLLHVKSSRDSSEDSSRETLPTICSSKSLFTKLATLSESESDMEDLDSDKTTEKSESLQSSHQIEDKLIEGNMKNELISSNKEQNDTSSKIAIPAELNVVYDISMEEPKISSFSRHVATEVDLSISQELNLSSTRGGKIDAASQIKCSLQSNAFSVVCTQTPKINFSSRSIATELDGLYSTENRLLLDKIVNPGVKSRIIVSGTSDALSAVQTQTPKFSCSSVHVATEIRNENELFLNTSENSDAVSQISLHRAAYLAHEPSHESQTFSQKGGCEAVQCLGYEIPKDIVVAFEIASQRAMNLYEAINIHKENMSRASKKLKIIKPMPEISCNDEPEPVADSDQNGSFCKAIDISRGNQLAELPIVSKNMKTVSQIKIIRPRLKVEFSDKVDSACSNHAYEVFDDCNENLPVGTTERASAAAVIKNREITTAELSPLKAIRTRIHALDVGISNGAKSLLKTVDIRKGNFCDESIIKSKSTIIIPREINTTALRESKIATATKRGGTSTTTECNQTMNVKKIELDLTKPLGIFPDTYEKSRIKTLLKENLERSFNVFPESKISKNSLIDLKQPHDITTGSSKPNATEVFAVSAKSCTCSQVPTIISRVNDKMDFYMHRVEEGSNSPKVKTICETQTIRSKVRKYKKPSKRQNGMKVLTAVACMERSIVDQRSTKMVRPKAIIVSRENLLAFIYGAVCSLVFCCLQFSISCEA